MRNGIQTSPVTILKKIRIDQSFNAYDILLEYKPEKWHRVVHDRTGFQCLPNNKFYNKAYTAKYMCEKNSTCKPLLSSRNPVPQAPHIMHN